MPEKLTIEYMISRLPFPDTSKRLLLERYPALSSNRKSIVVDEIWDLWDTWTEMLIADYKERAKYINAYSQYSGEPEAPIDIEHTDWREVVRRDIEQNNIQPSFIKSAEGIIRQTMGMLF